MEILRLLEACDQAVAPRIPNPRVRLEYRGRWIRFLRRAQDPWARALSIGPFSFPFDGSFGSPFWATEGHADPVLAWARSQEPEVQESIQREAEELLRLLAQEQTRRALESLRMWERMRRDPLIRSWERHFTLRAIVGQASPASIPALVLELAMDELRTILTIAAVDGRWPPTPFLARACPQGLEGCSASLARRLGYSPKGCLAQARRIRLALPLIPRPGGGR